MSRLVAYLLVCMLTGNFIFLAVPVFDSTVTLNM